MRKLVLPLALAAFVATGSFAFAATDHTVTGTLKAIDAKAETVTLGKSVYHFAKGFDLSTFKVGEKVSLTYHVSKKLDVGTKLVAAATPAAPAKPTTTKTMTTTKTTTTKKS
jgi:hypothetical protein